MTGGSDGTRRTVTVDELDEPLLSYDDAVSRIVAAFEPLPAATVPLEQSLGRVLAADVVSADDIPSFDNSAMDGYAVRSEDLAHGPRSRS
jgi:molybdopterin biosynthesis enzyme